MKRLSLAGEDRTVPWRLLLDGAATGAWNMAVDEALLRFGAHEKTPPTLRFYQWNPPCLSLGRFQKIREPAGIDFVRRPTGGRAVWHHHEITYSVTIRQELLPPEARSVLGAYRWLSGAFVAGLRELGIAAELARTPPHPAVPPETPRGTVGADCFAAAALCDFVVDERKLIGAAQCRKEGTILQHGALLLDVDAAAWRAALGEPPAGMVTLRALGVTASRATIIAALGRGVERVLHATLAPGGLTAAEQAMAQRLHKAKYGGRAWNVEAKDAD